MMGLLTQAHAGSRMTDGEEGFVAKKRIIGIGLEAIDRFVEWTVVALFLVMIVVGSAQVFNRFILNQSLSWSEELQRYLHIWIVYLTVPIAYRKGMHIGMETLKRRFPALVQRTIEVAVDLVWAGFGISVVGFSQRILQVSARQRSPGLGITMNWAYLGMVIGAGYLVLCALRRLATGSPATEGGTVPPSAEGLAEASPEGTL
jgi:TRAP-type C4-dicarboxylate transport system permease small subunit